MNVVLFEGKLEYLMEAIKKRSVTNDFIRFSLYLPDLSRLPTSTPNDAYVALPHSYEMDSGNCSMMSAYKDNIVDVDAAEYEDTIKQQDKSVIACQGYTVTLLDGTSPHTAYPFALHDTLILPWDYTVKNEVMKLFSQSCGGLTQDGARTCQPCQQLVKNKTLEGIFMRMEEGTHENTGFAYVGFSGLHQILRRKNQQVEFYHLQGLNQVRKLLAKATALSNQKRLLMAIASGKVSWVDCLLSIGLRQKKGAHGLLALYTAAAEDHYSPKSFTEEEDMKAILMWRLGGNRLAEINHCANQAQSVTYLRTRSTVPLIVPSPGQPTIDQVQANVKATFNGLLDVIHSQNPSRSNVHAVLMFDELATEKRIRWELKTNHFLGICREHVYKTSTEFINEDDMEELFHNLDDGNVHYAVDTKELL